MAVGSTLTLCNTGINISRIKCMQHLYPAGKLCLSWDKHVTNTNLGGNIRNQELGREKHIYQSKAGGHWTCLLPWKQRLGVQQQNIRAPTSPLICRSGKYHTDSVEHTDSACSINYFDSMASNLWGFIWLLEHYLYVSSSQINICCVIFEMKWAYEYVM